MRMARTRAINEGNSSRSAPEIGHPKYVILGGRPPVLAIRLPVKMLGRLAWRLEMGRSPRRVINAHEERRLRSQGGSTNI
jgi:hypothetical protein